ncbi:MAG: hydrolase [Hyphomicrobiales bacterium]|nr:MAG: hydrolase [Hyphomicrobiales bacterium]
MLITVPQLIIFDCDGVLIDSEVIVSKVEATELTRIGHPITPEETMLRFAGVPEKDMYLMVETEMGKSLPDNFSKRIDASIKQAYATDLLPISGVAETVQNLSIPYCVASSSVPDRLGLGLIQTELFGLFYPNIFSTVLVQNGKPAPDLFLYAAGKMATHPDRCVVIEDSIAGVKAAVAAGMIALGFIGGSHCTAQLKDGLLGAGATYIFDHFNELPLILEKIRCVGEG